MNIMEEEPLVNFSALRDKLIALGFHIKEQKGKGAIARLNHKMLLLETYRMEH